MLIILGGCYVLWGGFWGCQIIYPRIMRWYNSSTFLVFGTGPVDILKRQIIFGLQIRLFAVVLGVIVGCLGGAFYMQFFRSRPSKPKGQQGVASVRPRDPDPSVGSTASGRTSAMPPPSPSDQNPTQQLRPTSSALKTGGKIVKYALLCAGGIFGILLLIGIIVVATEHKGTTAAAAVAPASNAVADAATVTTSTPQPADQVAVLSNASPANPEIVPYDSIGLLMMDEETVRGKLISVSATVSFVKDGTIGFETGATNVGAVCEPSPDQRAAFQALKVGQQVAVVATMPSDGVTLLRASSQSTGQGAIGALMLAGCRIQ